MFFHALRILDHVYFFQFDMITKKTDDCKIKLSAINTLPQNITYLVDGQVYQLKAYDKEQEPIRIKGKGV